ncbi:unnamed protein product [Brassica rapa]|uniref:Uncharacterized protein n=1 Tax=Brassica campestris TaxID=3711 RepID=A0A8D9GWC0_BRACM|nr:unnamed protein product [Brassica rapa]
MVLKKYNEVLKDSVFGIIVAINEHNHGYSEKIWLMEANPNIDTLLAKKIRHHQIEMSELNRS